ncbi:major facilitator superfamily domain-containing protein [Globomyces pollinis-pini]|nr:major facilitator superfamily domain-containing protein [Globomyces pollinis-pini]
MNIRYNLSTSVAILVGFAIFCDQFVYGVLVPTLPAIATRQNISTSDLGLVMSSYSVGIVVTPVVAIISDTWGNRKIPMVVASFVLAFAMLLFAWGTSMEHFLIARMIQGIVGGVSWMIGFSMLAESFPTHLGKVMGSVMTANTLGNLAGPPMGGLFFDYLGELSPLYLCFGVCLLDTLFRLVIVRPIFSWNYEKDKEGQESEPFIEHQETQSELVIPQQVGLLKIICNPKMLITLFAIIVGEAVLTGIEPTLPLYLQTRFGYGPSKIGILWMSITIPKMFSCTYAGILSDSYGRKNTTILGLMLFSLGCFPLGLANEIWLLCIILCLFGVGAGISLTPGVPEMAELAKQQGDTSYGTVYSLYNIASSVGMMLGPIIGSWIYGNYGFLIQLQVFSGFLVVTAFILFIFQHTGKKSEITE